jgi:hypothetical protein
MSSSNKTTSAPPDFSPPKDESFFQELPSAPAVFSLRGDGEPYVSKIADLHWRAINNSIGHHTPTEPQSPKTTAAPTARAASHTPPV